MADQVVRLICDPLKHVMVSALLLHLILYCILRFTLAVTVSCTYWPVFLLLVLLPHFFTAHSHYYYMTCPQRWFALNALGNRASADQIASHFYPSETKR